MSKREGARDFWRVIAGFLLPPLGVFMQSGLGMHFWINLVMALTGFLYIPAQLHAIWVIATVGEDGEVAADGTSTFIGLLVAFWLPPVGVFMKRGLGKDFIINLILTCLFFLPGQLHAVWSITTHEE